MVMPEGKRTGSSFISDTVAELKKVTWLSWNEALRLTSLVLGISVVVGLILGGLDYGFSALVSKLFVGG